MIVADFRYNNIGTKFNILKGLNNEVKTQGNSGWVSKANYTLSLFNITECSASEHTCEVQYVWDSDYCWGTEQNAIILNNKECVKALCVGCNWDSIEVSARTVNCNKSAAFSYQNYAGVFSVCPLKLT